MSVDVHEMKKLLGYTLATTVRPPLHPKGQRDKGLKGNLATSPQQQAAGDEGECGEQRRWFRDRSEFAAGNAEA